MKTKEQKSELNFLLNIVYIHHKLENMKSEEQKNEPVRCYVCNEVFIPDPGEDPICTECLKDLREVNKSHASKLLEK